MTDEQEVHRVQTNYDDEFGGYHWECDCGMGGSGGPGGNADLHSDRHIPEGARRIDVQGGSL